MLRHARDLGRDLPQPNKSPPKAYNLHKAWAIRRSFPGHCKAAFLLGKSAFSNDVSHPSPTCVSLKLTGDLGVATLFSFLTVTGAM